MAVRNTAEAQVTTNHEEIRQWVESRGGKPAAVKATHRGGDPGIIRLIFPEAPNADGDNLEEISWDEFLENSTRPASRVSTKTEHRADRQASLVS